MAKKATKTKRRKVATLTLDRSRWVGGSLLHCRKGQAAYCAVGGYLLALGVAPEKIKDCGAAEQAIPKPDESFPEEGRWLFSDWNDPNLDDSLDADDIYHASDGQREQEVIEIFKTHKVKVKYTGEYP